MRHPDKLKVISTSAQCEMPLLFPCALWTTLISVYSYFIFTIYFFIFCQTCSTYEFVPYLCKCCELSLGYAWELLQEILPNHPGISEDILYKNDNQNRMADEMNKGDASGCHFLCYCSVLNLEAKMCVGKEVLCMVWGRGSLWVCAYIYSL